MQMHRLTGEGKFESPEAEVLRDSMDEPWEQLSDVERKRIQGLSLDLDDPDDSSQAADPHQSDAASQRKLFEVFLAQDRKEWDRALELLRQWAPYASSPGFVAYLRGAIWQEAGEARVAALFFQQASRLEPSFSPQLLSRSESATSLDPGLGQSGR